jgi:ATP-dependent helicase HrpB
VDLTHRIENSAAIARRRAGRCARDGEAVERPRRRRGEGDMSAGAILSLALSDRIAKESRQRVVHAGERAWRQRRSGASLAREPFIAVGELTGSAAQGRIVLAAPIVVG